MLEHFITVVAALLSVTNPLGTVPIYAALSEDYDAHERKITALKTGINVLLILIISFFGGQYVLGFFGIGLDSLRFAGGLIIASSGFALLNGSFSKSKGMTKKNKKAASKREGISMTPLAMPMIAGPGSISLLIAFQQTASDTNSSIASVLAIITASAVIYLVLLSSTLIIKKLGPNGINAISRIIGFLVIAIGIEYVGTAVRGFITTL